jgi:hypothetical protein
MVRGFPRPHDPTYHLPVPYSSYSVDLIGAGSDVRIGECVLAGLCTVCGLPLEKESYAAVSNTDPGKGGISKFDPGLCHEKCSKLAVAMCPHFREGRSVMVRVCTDEVLAGLRALPDDVRFWFLK